jgi:hypothetical protein
MIKNEDGWCASDVEAPDQLEMGLSVDLDVGDPIDLLHDPT